MRTHPSECLVKLAVGFLESALLSFVDPNEVIKISPTAKTPSTYRTVDGLGNDSVYSGSEVRREQGYA